MLVVSELRQLISLSLYEGMTANDIENFEFNANALLDEIETLLELEGVED